MYLGKKSLECNQADTAFADNDTGCSQIRMHNGRDEFWLRVTLVRPPFDTSFGKSSIVKSIMTTRLNPQELLLVKWHQFVTTTLAYPRKILGQLLPIAQCNAHCSYITHGLEAAGGQWGDPNVNKISTKGGRGSGKSVSSIYLKLFFWKWDFCFTKFSLLHYTELKLKVTILDK